VIWSDTLFFVMPNLGSVFYFSLSLGEGRGEAILSLHLRPHSMASIITYQNCPACGAASISEVLQCKDFTVSGEQFDIWECGHCSLRFTQQVPSADSIAPYYKSDTYISHTDTSKGLINKIYKLVRRYTLGRKRLYVQQTTQKIHGLLLDVGSGTGAFLNEMKQAGWKVLGVEPDPSARAKAQELYQIQPRPSEALFDLMPGLYDAISMWHVLEHVHDLQGYMKQLKQLLTPAGKLFIAVPNYTSADAQHYGTHWAAYDVPRHLYHFSPKSMEMLAAKHGFKLLKYKPMWADPFYIAMLSEQHKTGKINYITALWQGARSAWKTVFQRDKCSSLIYVLEPI
jgi:2-polyprenyl-3-methyl-5-hydroxy-6-metoxy-1,4-benzoquinol methylase